MASQDFSSFQLGSATALPLSQGTPCACPRATLVWVAHDPPTLCCICPYRWIWILSSSLGAKLPLARDAPPSHSMPKMQPPSSISHPPPSHLPAGDEFLVLSSFHTYSDSCSPLQSFILSLLSCSYPALAALD